jgi:large subunit ribosomal protein L17
MFANMASSLIMHDRIETTLPKAKELRRLAEKLVTLAKNGTVAARRRAITLIRDKKAVGKAFEHFAKRFEGRMGGYTRIMKLGNRRGDAAPMAIIEYLRGEGAAEASATKRTVKPKKPAVRKAAAKKADDDSTEKKPRARKAAAKNPAVKKPSAAKLRKSAGTKKIGE